MRLRICGYAFRLNKVKRVTLKFPVHDHPYHAQGVAFQGCVSNRIPAESRLIRRAGKGGDADQEQADEKPSDNVHADS
ncbi:MAG: hypothetical protein E6K39_17980 [Gammaproteobacteria bacterium]|nr:MAG: hypothetical protein E6K39_17980 [Gammaproteobacteria bacterium]